MDRIEQAFTELSEDHRQVIIQSRLLGRATSEIATDAAPRLADLPSTPAPSVMMTPP